MKKEIKIKKTSPSDVRDVLRDGSKKPKLKPVGKDKYKPGKFIDDEDDGGLDDLYSDEEDYEDEDEEKSD